MAELERAEHGENGNARLWMQRAVRAALDPAWTADGYVSERWRPVSPVSGRLDAFQWLTPVAASSVEKRRCSRLRLWKSPRPAGSAGCDICGSAAAARNDAG